MSEHPLKLAHVPWADGYQALPATIRSLTLEEVQTDIQMEQSLRDATERSQRERELTGLQEKPTLEIPKAHDYAVTIAHDPNPGNGTAIYSAVLKDDPSGLNADGTGKTPRQRRLRN